MLDLECKTFQFENFQHFSPFVFALVKNSHTKNWGYTKWYSWSKLYKSRFPQIDRLKMIFMNFLWKCASTRCFFATYSLCEVGHIILTSFHRYPIQYLPHGFWGVPYILQTRYSRKLPNRRIDHRVKWGWPGLYYYPGIKTCEGGCGLWFM